jgi:hypothetical protein
MGRDPLLTGAIGSKTFQEPTLRRDEQHLEMKAVAEAVAEVESKSFSARIS